MCVCVCGGGGGGGGLRLLVGVKWIDKDLRWRWEGGKVVVSHSTHNF